MDELSLGLTSLSETAAEALSRFQGSRLDFDGLTTISAATAMGLSKYEGDLYLLTLNELSEASAEALAGHKGGLILPSLTTISDAAADSLSKHKGELYLDGITTLSDAAADSLSKHEGEICDQDPADWADFLREDGEEYDDDHESYLYYEDEDVADAELHRADHLCLLCLRNLFEHGLIRNTSAGIPQHVCPNLQIVSAW